MFKTIKQYIYVNTIQHDLLPISLLIPKYIQSLPNHKVLMALFDCGGSISFIHKFVSSPNIIPVIGSIQNFITLVGKFKSHHQISLEEIVLSEFKHTAYIDSQQCQEFNGLCFYDIILGCDF